MLELEKDILTEKNLFQSISGEVGVVYILYSGLRHMDWIRTCLSQYRIHEFFYDEKRDTLYPSISPEYSPFDSQIVFKDPEIMDKACREKLKEITTVYLVDNNSVTANTLIRAVRKLNLDWDKVVFASTPQTDLASTVVDVHLPQPIIRGYLIAITGHAGAGKSRVAAGIANEMGVRHIKWGEYAGQFAGKYGEELIEIERANPYFIANIVVDDLIRCDDPVLVIDGIKHPEQLSFLSNALVRPTSLIFIDISEDTRKRAIALRSMPDDVYDDERRKIFEENMVKLKRHAAVVLKIDDEWNNPLFEKLLAAHGLKVRKHKFGVNYFITKRNLLESYRMTCLKPKPIGRLMYIDPREFDELFHKSYVQRVEKELGVKLDEDRKNLIIYTATSFRIIDDIIDEHTVRDGKPAWWAVRGVFKSIIDAVELVLHSRFLAEKLGIHDEYTTMFNRVVDSVMVELEMEEGAVRWADSKQGRSGNSNSGNKRAWFRAAGREAWFRWFLARLVGKPDMAGEMYLDGLKAQVKDDVLGKEKGGRENTDDALNRPLFQDFFPDIAKEIFDESERRNC